MLAFLIIMSFMLAILAHIKLLMFQRGIVTLFDALDEHIEAVRREKSIEVQSAELVVEPYAVPEKPDFVDSSVLESFYGLQDRGPVFHAVAKSGALNATQLFQLYHACYGETPMSRSLELQTLLRNVDLRVYDLLKSAIYNATVDSAESRIVDKAKVKQEASAESRIVDTPKVKQDASAESRIVDTPKVKQEASMDVVLDAEVKPKRMRKPKTAEPVEAST